MHPDLALTARHDGQIARRHLLGMRVDAVALPDAVERLIDWAQRGESRYVCVATVNMVMEARGAPEFLRIVNEADLVTPDGMPVVWGLRWLGCARATRVCGPDLTPEVLRAAAVQGVPVGFYGGTPQAQDRLVAVARARFPGLAVAFAESPPFRALTEQEDRECVERLNRSGARLLFVGLGCPKQERWMAAHRGRVQAVMLGVGAAFDFLAGTKPRAPLWMQRAGLEWVFRLKTEPGRLWRRYLLCDSRFLALLAIQVLRRAAGRIHQEAES